MDWFVITKYGLAFLAALATVFFPQFLSKRKTARKAAEEREALATERDTAVAAAEDATAKAQDAQAELDLTEKMQAEVQAAETAYQMFDAVAKQNGTTTGAMKREHVLDKLQAYALSKGYTFDAEKWGAAIDAFILVTKVVNAIKK